MWLTLIGIGVTFLVAVGVFAVALLRPNPAQRLRRVESTGIGDVREGELVKVNGSVVSDRLLRAPYTDRPCVYYRLEMSQDRAGLEVIEHWLEESCDFTIEDESGVSLVVAERASFEVVCDSVEMERASRLSPHGREVARQCGWALAHVAQIEIREGIIAPGELVDVVGSATREPVSRPEGKESGYSEAPGTLLVFRAEPAVLGADRPQQWIGAS